MLNYTADTTSGLRRDLKNDSRDWKGASREKAPIPSSISPYSLSRLSLTASVSTYTSASSESFRLFRRVGHVVTECQYCLAPLAIPWQAGTAE